MKEAILELKAVEEISRRALACAVPEPRVIHADAQAEWEARILRRISSHNLHVLQRAPDMIVFFDSEGRVVGWRDDGRNGALMPAWIKREVFLASVVKELDLPKETRLGRLEPAELPPVGWTHEAVLFLSPVPSPEEILRVWAAPDTLRIIQCLTGPAPGEDQP